MNKKQFIKNFVTTFLATHAANKYETACMHGEEITYPIEDAEYEAVCAWEELKKLSNIITWTEDE